MTVSKRKRIGKFDHTYVEVWAECLNLLQWSFSNKKYMSPIASVNTAAHSVSLIVYLNNLKVNATAHYYGTSELLFNRFSFLFPALVLALRLNRL